MARAKAIMLHAVTIILACALSSGLTLWLVNADSEKAPANARPTSDKEIIESMYGFYKAYDYRSSMNHITAPGWDMDSGFLSAEVYIGEDDFFCNHHNTDITRVRIKNPDYRLVKLDDDALQEAVKKFSPDMAKEPLTEDDFAYALYPEGVDVIVADVNEMRIQSPSIFLQINDKYYYVFDRLNYFYLERISV